jgi:RNA polymerase sigma-70 factor (ECF subfamily)
VLALLERQRNKFWPPMGIEDDESALIGRVADGDHGAFAALYDRLGSLVYGVSKRVLHDPSYAEEVTQEVFLEIWRQAPRFDGSRGSVRAWAATIARRRAVDRVRSEQARRDRQRADAAVADPPPPATDEAAIDRDLRTRARDALGQLSAPQREVLELAYFGGLTHVEIANHLGIALGTAKTRVRDGLIKLRQVMETT